MTTEQISKQIKDWQKRNALKTDVTLVLLDCFRRKNQFKDSTFSFLGYPSETKNTIALGYLKPFSNEIKRALNWYVLTEKGEQILSDLKLSYDEAVKAYLEN
jgi:hypothetical protein